MAKKKKAPECPAGEKWAVPYADFLSLLLALFIALWAISNVDQAKANAMTTAMIKIFEFPDSSSATKKQEGGRQGRLENANTATTLNQQNQDGQTIKINRRNERYNIALDQAENQIALDLPTEIKFDNASASIDRDDIKLFLRTVSMIAAKLPNSVSVEIRGFADDHLDYIENYQLSAKRGFNVLNQLIVNGVEPKRLQFLAMGQNYRGWRSGKDLKIAKIFFKVDIRDQRAQKSVLDLISTIK